MQPSAIVPPNPTQPNNNKDTQTQNALKYQRSETVFCRPARLQEQAYVQFKMGAMSLTWATAWEQFHQNKTQLDFKKNTLTNDKAQLRIAQFSGFDKVGQK